MGARVAVAGASGYAGGELLRLLLGHPDLEIGALTAHASAGVQVTEIHPHLPELDGATFTATEPAALADADLLFTALPHGESAKLAAALPASLKMIDLGADFRLNDADTWATYYPGTPHAGQWTYGLPELPGARDAIKAASKVAAPGCYATASILALAPLLAGNLVDAKDIVIVAASGTSGAGRALKPELLATDVMGSMRAYGVGGTHRHTPEIEQALGHGATISFTPVLAPMPRGILATCTARLAARAGARARAGAGAGVSERQLADTLKAAYHDEPFVHVLPANRWPSTNATAGSNTAQLQVAADTHAGRAIVVSAIDNLGKGAAGQAVQIANIMLGLPESTGLKKNGVAP
ncbi:MAG TPA: N-acetyl-gamma-glutamyl-phosphate reductase [Streptosporangiaceae bacterium]|nr:N-acetyl-gamma-glutamyl-phosphate reductase [Streptosporangiaceae bacterium]